MSDTSPSDVKPPRTVVAAFVAVCVQAGMGIVGSLLLFGAGNYLHNEILKANHDAQVKNKKLPYDLTTHDVAHYVHQSQVSGLISSLIFGALFVLLGVLFWRGKSWARWVLIVAAILTQQPFRILGFGGNAPADLKVTIVVGGLASLASIVLVLLPESSRYFAAKRGVPAGGADGPVRPAPLNLRTLFMPRAAQRTEEPPARPATRVARPPAREPVEAATTADGAAPRAKAKARVSTPEPAPARSAAKSRSKGKAR